MKGNTCTFKGVRNQSWLRGTPPQHGGQCSLENTARKQTAMASTLRAPPPLVPDHPPVCAQPAWATPTL